MRQRDFPRARLGATAHQRHAARGVVRVAKWALAPAIHDREPAHRAHRCHLQRLVTAQRGQNAGQAARQHGLAGTRRPRQQQVVPAGCGHFQRPARLVLTFDVSHVGLNHLGARRCPKLVRRKPLTAQQMPHHRQQMPRREHLAPLGQGCLIGVGRGHDQPPPGGPRSQRRRQYASDRAQRAI